MVDSDKRVAYWEAGASEDWQVAHELIERRRVRHTLFFAHLALEKALKAHVCRNTGQLAPRIHNLVRLAEVAGLRPREDQLDVLAEMNQFNLEGRYPEFLTPPPPLQDARAYLNRAEGVYKWLTNPS